MISFDYMPTLLQNTMRILQGISFLSGFVHVIHNNGPSHKLCYVATKLAKPNFQSQFAHLQLLIYTFI